MAGFVSKVAGMAKGMGKVGKVMGEFKRGSLRSSAGPKVTNPKQAIAIGLSEARSAGARIRKPAQPAQPRQPEATPRLTSLARRLRGKKF